MKLIIAPYALAGKMPPSFLLILFMSIWLTQSGVQQNVMFERNSYPLSTINSKSPLSQLWLEHEFNVCSEDFAVRIDVSMGKQWLHLRVTFMPLLLHDESIGTAAHHRGAFIMALCRSMACFWQSMTPRGYKTSLCFVLMREIIYTF